jgi:hypothetical protein
MNFKYHHLKRININGNFWWPNNFSDVNFKTIFILTSLYDSTCITKLKDNAIHKSKISKILNLKENYHAEYLIINL